MLVDHTGPLKCTVYWKTDLQRDNTGKQTNKQKPNKTLDWTLSEALTFAKTKFTNGQLLLFHYFKLPSETLNSLNA